MSAFNKHFPAHHADSRGTKVEKDGITLQEFGANNTIRIMDQEGLDVRKSQSRQLRHGELKKYDAIVVMSEPENTPPWLESHPKAERWDITDTKTTDFRTTRAIYLDLKRRILQRFIEQ